MTHHVIFLPETTVSPETYFCARGRSWDFDKDLTRAIRFSRAEDASAMKDALQLFTARTKPVGGI